MSLFESGIIKLSDRRQELVTYCLRKSYRTSRVSSKAFSLLLQSLYLELKKLKKHTEIQARFQDQQIS